MAYKKQNYPECSICGSIIWGKPSHIIIEGVKVTVCQSCSHLGNKTSGTTSQKIQSKVFYKKSIRRSPVATPRKQKTSQKLDNKTNLQIVADYATKIKNLREKNRLTQGKFALKLHETESIIRNVESGKRIPTIALAKKIEQTYGIKLTEKKEDDDIDYRRYIQKKKAPMTLGDTVVVKKKKKPSN